MIDRSQAGRHGHFASQRKLVCGSSSLGTRLLSALATREATRKCAAVQSARANRRTECIVARAVRRTSAAPANTKSRVASERSTSARAARRLLALITTLSRRSRGSVALLIDDLLSKLSIACPGDQRLSRLRSMRAYRNRPLNDAARIANTAAA
jgi:hypothetical protein